MEKQFDTPILYLIFNRPDLVEKTFSQIKEQRPRQLFIGADGPRGGNENDRVKCAEARQWVLDQIDWECDVHTLFREENLGCGLAVSGAITWFFEHVEMGIILEDDCLSVESFFQYAQELLIRYQSHEKVFGITGLNQQQGNKRGDSSYYFSYFPATWGWASWRNRWSHFEYYPSGVAEFIESELFVQHHNIKSLQERIEKSFENMGKPDVWDYQWRFEVFRNQGLIAVPQVNLVSNIGFGEHATHTFDENSKSANRKLKNISFPLRHPVSIKVDEEADKFMFRMKPIGFKQRLRNGLKRMSPWK